jgi:hypothetical protein
MKARPIMNKAGFQREIVPCPCCECGTFRHEIPGKVTIYTHLFSQVGVNPVFKIFHEKKEGIR